MSKIKSTELFKEQVLLPSAPFSADGPIIHKFNSGTVFIVR